MSCEIGPRFQRNTHSSREEMEEKEGFVMSVVSLGFGCPDL